MQAYHTDTTSVNAVLDLLIPPSRHRHTFENNRSIYRPIQPQIRPRPLKHHESHDSLALGIAYGFYGPCLHLTYKKMQVQLLDLSD